MQQKIISLLCLSLHLIIPSKEISLKILLHSYSKSRIIFSFLMWNDSSSLYHQLFWDPAWILGFCAINLMSWYETIFFLKIVLKLILLTRIQDMSSHPWDWWFSLMIHFLIFEPTVFWQTFNYLSGDSAWEGKDIMKDRWVHLTHGWLSWETIHIIA